MLKFWGQFLNDFQESIEEISLTFSTGAVAPVGFDILAWGRQNFDMMIILGCSSIYLSDLVTILMITRQKTAFGRLLARSGSL